MCSSDLLGPRRHRVQLPPAKQGVTALDKLIMKFTGAGLVRAGMVRRRRPASGRARGQLDLRLDDQAARPVRRFTFRTPRLNVGWGHGRKGGGCSGGLRGQGCVVRAAWSGLRDDGFGFGEELATEVAALTVDHMRDELHRRFS